MPRRIGQQDIAERAGVHITTVSLALRGHPRIPFATRERIRKLAQEMGYEPDPVLSALNTYRRNSRKSRHHGVLAWINNYDPPDILYEVSDFRDYRDGAAARCLELGYRLEEFASVSMTGAQLSRILHWRGIQGLLFPPQPEKFESLTLDWDRFSSVAFGFRIRHPILHRVCNSMYRSAKTATQMMHGKGYRRIGFVDVESSEQNTDENFLAGFHAVQRHFPKREQVPPLIFEDTRLGRSAEAARGPFKKRFERWFSTHRPDAVLGLDSRLPQFFEQLGIDFQDCGLASLVTSRDSTLLAGIHQNGLIVGGAAVDFTVGMIMRNERGIPHPPFELLVEGVWMDGPSLPGPSSQPAPARARRVRAA